MQGTRHIFGFCLIVTTAAVSATAPDDISTKTDDITTKCDDIITGVLERLKYLEERDKQHEQTKAELEMLKQRLEDQEGGKGSLGRLRRYSIENPVAFYAKMSSNHHLNQGETIAFDQALTNVGNFYNNKTGIFMSPSPGVYVFSVTLMTQLSTDTHAGIYVNGVMKTYLKLYGTEHQYDTMSQTAVYVLHQGDVVTVQHMESDKYIHGGYSSFSGFLLYQDLSNPPMAIVG